MESESLQLRELVPAEPFIQPPGWPWWAWVALATSVIGFALLMRLFRRKKSTNNAPDLQLISEQAFRLAMEKIDLAGKQTAIPSAATTCSEAIRRYLATVTSDPSLYETHEEFLARHESLKDYPLEVRDAASTGFCRLARLKYGKSPTGDSSSIANEGRSLLKQLHQHRPA